MFKVAKAPAVVLGAFIVSLPTLASATDTQKGKNLFVRCLACHKVGAGARHGVGPHLNEVFGRKAGTIADYRGFSSAMKAAGKKGLVWTNETLDKYIENPRKMIPRTRMTFLGMRNKSDRAALLLYLQEFSKTTANKQPEEANKTPERSKSP